MFIHHYCSFSFTDFHWWHPPSCASSAFAHFSIQRLSYVFPSVPHTGCRMAWHIQRGSTAATNVTKAKSNNNAIVFMFTSWFRLVLFPNEVFFLNIYIFLNVNFLNVMKHFNCYVIAICIHPLLLLAYLFDFLNNCNSSKSKIIDLFHTNINF